MNELLKLMESKGIQLSADELEARIRDMGYDPTALSAKDIAQLATALMQQTGTLTTSKGGKVSAKRDRKKTQKGDALQHLGRQLDEEIQAFTDPVVEGIERLEQFHIDRLAQRFSEAPGNVVKGVVAEAGGYQADAEFFRQEARDLIESLGIPG